MPLGFFYVFKVQNGLLLTKFHHVLTQCLAGFFCTNRFADYANQSTYLYHWENKNSALFVFASHNIIMLNSVYCCKPCPMHGRSKTQLRPIMCPHWPSLSFPLPLPPITWPVYGENRPPHSRGHVGLFKLSPEHCFVSTQNHSHIDLWSAWMVLTHHHHLHRQQLPLRQNPPGKSKLTLV